MPWLGHQGVLPEATFDDPRLDAAGTVGHLVAGDLKKLVLAQSSPNECLRRHEPLGQKRVARDRKAHLTRQLLVNKRRLRTDPPDQVVRQERHPELTGHHLR